jgi:hypothetical protein
VFFLEANKFFDLDYTIEVSASYDAPTTKGGHADLLPIAQLPRPFLVEAMKRSSSDLVFPRADGTMHSPELKLVGEGGPDATFASTTCGTPPRRCSSRKRAARDRAARAAAYRPAAYDRDLRSP